MRIDAHTHSATSDGTDAPAEVVRRAAAAGIDVLGLTDHDTVAGHGEAAAALRPGQTLLPGAELSCLVDGLSVHLLAYLFDPAEPALAAELERVREDRERRARGMVDRLRRLGVPVEWERVHELAAGEVVGRPHVARGMVEAGVVPDVPSAFTRAWLAPGGRAYVHRYAPEPVRAVGLVRSAGGVSVLAHPHASEWRARPEGASRQAGACSDDMIARLADAGLCGIEVDHPEHDAWSRRVLRGLARDLELAVTGGSDDHGELTGHRLGAATTAPREYERLVSQASALVPMVG